MECVWLYDLILAVTCLPARRVWAAGNGGGRWKGRGVLLLLDVTLTHPSDTGRRFIPGWKSFGPEWQAWFTSIQIHLLYFPHKPFSFQAPLLPLWNAVLLGTKHHSSLCEYAFLCVCVCECGLIPCNPKTFLSFFLSFFEKKWISVEEESRVFLSVVFFIQSLWCRPPTTAEDLVQSVFTT